MVWLSKMVSAQHCSTLNFLDGRRLQTESLLAVLYNSIFFLASFEVTEPGSPYTAETNRAVPS
jgi:hypothetical protein